MSYLKTCPCGSGENWITCPCNGDYETEKLIALQKEEYENSLEGIAEARSKEMVPDFPEFFTPNHAQQSLIRNERESFANGFICAMQEIESKIKEPIEKIIKYVESFPLSYTQTMILHYLQEIEKSIPLTGSGRAK